ncbi:phage antirepressor KilAC domain-containing protein [Sphingomonas prati]|uniref:Prophage antirepressor-like protein n=1 Tax=Sphingomonas prati TaxID=1843237 RepID=A0A7W9BQL4_9SPHN|nr:phage antirepressor KilAC domain-containing protein [Sphingomonas prati]MBB5728295.1 prophage antirepressor-like protein [Sphingomonas prati]GGE74957.1 antirepressor [Sphingomonas prati]
MPNSNLIPFSFGDQPVRVIDQNGDPWFMLADVCAVLGMGNPSQAATRLDDDEKDTLTNDEGIAGPQVQAFTIINESGLWSLVLTSRKPEAKAFKKWITSEVIPAIRKTGSFGVVDPMAALNDPAAMRGILLSYTEKVLELQGEVEEMRPQVQALERIAISDGSLCVTDAAKTLQVQPKALFAFLRSHGWIYTRAGSNESIAYQIQLQRGLLEHKTTVVSRSDGSEKTITQVRVTPKGLIRLAKEFPPIAMAA